MTVLWSRQLPDAFKRFCLKISAETSSLQYENDDLMRPYWGDDYGIACCVSAMRIGNQMQFFGARVNLGKCLLYAINGGRDEVSGEQVGPAASPVSGDVLEYEDVVMKFDVMMDWLARAYVHAMNCIHYMHDKYYYERLEMALHDQQILRTMAFGIAGLSVVADSLSAIKHAKVKPIRRDDGLIVSYEITGDYPQYGNNDDRVDSIAVDLVSTFMKKIRKHPTYRNAVHTQSVLTITSNVVYGRNTGDTPDAQDGISYTVSITPSFNRQDQGEKITQAVKVMDTYCGQGGFHMNLNVLNRDTLIDAMEHPDKYPQLTIRVSGYAVNFVRLTREQQMDVISRTFHGE